MGLKREIGETGEKCKFPGAPCRLSRSPWIVGRRVPSLGQDNEEIYKEELELSEDEMGALIEKGVI